VLGWLAGVGLLLGQAGLAAAQPAASSWPLFHGDAQRTGRTAIVGPASPANARVAYEAFGAMRGSAVIGPDGTVYFAQGRKLCALDPSDDSEKWCYELNATAIFASPALGVDPMNPGQVLIYQGDRGNRLHAVDQNGMNRWTYQVGIDGDVATSAVMNAAGNVFFGGAQRMHSISQAGVLNWFQGLDGVIFMANPVLSPSGNTVYVGTIGGSLYSFTVGGTENWRITISRNIRFGAMAVAADGTIYAGTRDGLVSVTDNGMSATINWTYPMSGRGAVSTPAIGPDGTIYVGGKAGAGGGTFFAVNPDASTAWTYDSSKFFRGSPILDGAGRIYTTSGRDVIALDSNNPSDPFLWSYTTRRNLYSSPAIAPDGTLWVPGSDRNVYAISD
jgi:outer membrane protein assembly factor BamB